MNETRLDKLQKLGIKAGRQDILILTSTEQFTDALDKKIDSLKNTLAEGVELSNLDELLDNLNVLSAFHEEVVQLRVVAEGIKAITLPEKITVDGIKELVDSIKQLPQPNIVNKIVNTNVIDEYRAANGDETDDVNSYYGFVHATGKWYILWISGGITTAAYKYAVGSDKYGASWGNRKKLNYSRYDEIKL